MAATNQIRSPLARAAHEAILLHAAPERSVAATKTYVVQLTALSLFASVLKRDRTLRQAHDRLPDLLRATLECEQGSAELARRWAGVKACVVSSLGYNDTTAREAALKLKEVAYVAAEALSSADFLHGSVALVGQGSPVLGVVPPGPARRQLAAVARQLRGRGADVVALSSDWALLKGLPGSLYAPGGLPEELTPHVYALSVQLLAYHLGIARGTDPDRPRGLRKVTRVL